MNRKQSVRKTGTNMDNRHGELGVQLIMNTYNNKKISINVKLRRYQTVTRPEALYTSERLNLTKTGLFKNLELLLKKILGPQITEDGS